MPTEVALRGIGVSVYEHSRPFRTETREDTDAPLLPSKRGRIDETNVVGLGPREAFSDAKRPSRDPQLPLPDATQLKSLPAVVTGVNDISVIITCQLPKGEVDVRLPKSVVPPQLAVFGTPVALSVDEDGGFRRPVLVERHIEPRARTPEEIEVDEWIES
jgi:hypothetical protein